MQIMAKVWGLGKRYKDGTEQLELAVYDEDWQALPIRLGERVPITLVVGGQRYKAGLRSTTRAGAWISPDLLDNAKRPTKLAYVLPKSGYEKNQSVMLEVSGTVVTLKRAGKSR
jgi:hypothetical protein